MRADTDNGSIIVFFDGSIYLPTGEAELKKIEIDSTKRFVLEVAREIKLESAAKQRFIKEWLGTQLTIEELFPVE